MTSPLTNHEADLAEEAGAAWRRYERSSREAVESYLEAGRLLTEGKAACRHGSWLAFLDRAGIVARTAQRAMQLHAANLTPDDVEAHGGIRASLESLAQHVVSDDGPMVNPESDTVTHSASRPGPEPDPEPVEGATIIEGDCLEVLRSGAIAPGSVALIVTSPPYANQRADTYGGIDPDKYGAWFLARAAEFAKVLAPDGSLVVNLKEHTDRGARHPYVYRLALAMQETGWRLIDEYQWHKTNPVPGRWPDRLRDGFERCYHFARDGGPVKFRPDAVKVPASEKTLLDRERVIERGDDPRRRSATGSHFDTQKNLSRFPTTVDPSNVIRIPVVSTNVGHPAAYPESLPAFFVKLLTDPGDLVADPFVGSGATIAAAQALGRRAVGIELVPEYAKLARRRLRPNLPTKAGDKFYTKPEIARYCIEVFERVCDDHGIDLDAHHWVEPAAGSGAFLAHFPEGRRTGIDVEPAGEDIQRADFLSWSLPAEPHVVATNPPFGKQGRLALEFVNRAMLGAKAGAFILPMSFGKVHSEKSRSREVRAAMLHSEDLPHDAFVDNDGRPQRIPCLLNVYVPLSDYAEMVRIDGPFEVSPEVAAVADVRHVARVSRRSPRRDPRRAHLYLRAKVFASGADDGALAFDYPMATESYTTAEPWGDLVAVRFKGEHPELRAHLLALPWADHAAPDTGRRSRTLGVRRVQLAIGAWLRSREAA